MTYLMKKIRTVCSALDMGDFKYHPHVAIKILWSWKKVHFQMHTNEWALGWSILVACWTLNLMSYLFILAIS